MRAAPNHTYTVFFSAGEASGDRLAAGLVRRIRSERPEWRICGIGGEAMRGAGFELLLDVTGASAIGISESLRVLPLALGALLRARRLVRRIRPDIFVAVDCQGLNMPLIRTARRAGARIVYFVPPQNFLWGDVRYGRRVVRRTDLLLNIYKKGHEFYTALGGRSIYYGHPLAESGGTQGGVATPAPIQEQARGFKTVVLAAGARKNEMRRFIPLLAAAASLIREECPAVHFITPAANAGHGEKLVKGFLRRGIVAEARAGEGIFTGADAAIIKSGTMSLEAALARCPYTVFYRVSGLTWLIMARLWGIKKNLRFISLPNILTQKELAREFMQREARPEPLAREALRFIMDREEAAKQAALLGEFAREIAESGAWSRASRALADFAEE